jgi:hypothetical protein
MAGPFIDFMSFSPDSGFLPTRFTQLRQRLRPHAMKLGIPMHHLAFEADLSAAWFKVAGDDLDERQLAGAVVAHQADYFARENLYVHAMQRADRTKLLTDTSQF